MWAGLTSLRKRRREEGSWRLLMRTLHPRADADEGQVLTLRACGAGAGQKIVCRPTKPSLSLSLSLPLPLSPAVDRALAEVAHVCMCVCVCVRMRVCVSDSIRGGQGSGVGACLEDHALKDKIFFSLYHTHTHLWRILSLRQWHS